VVKALIAGRSRVRDPEISTINRKTMFLESKARSLLRADNLSVIYEPIVYTMWDSQNLAYRPPRPATGIVFFLPARY
jgi:hypothetical protein